MTPAIAELRRVSRVLVEHADVLEHRVREPDPPEWCRTRGWTEFLAALSEEDLNEAETLGLDAVADGAPQSLLALCRASAELAAPFRGEELVRAVPDAEGVKRRKSAQIALLLDECRLRFPAARRIIDVGAGNGHLTRVLAAKLGIVALGMDRDPARIATASALGGARFSVADGDSDFGAGLGDLVVGLHACGALGDALVRRAASGSASVFLVSCCPHKTPLDKRPALSRAGAELGLDLSRVALGVANIAHTEDAAHMERIMSGRLARHAIRLLLRARGVREPAGHELHGIHRRTLRRSLAEAAEIACARRGLGAPTSDELAAAHQDAVREHALMRRLSLPRYLLGRLVELALVLDRAAYLEEHGYATDVRAVFPLSLSPRNVAITAIPS